MLGFKKIASCCVMCASAVLLSSCEEVRLIDGIAACMQPDFLMGVDHLPSGEACIDNNGELQLWSKDSRYQTDLARFDIDTLTGVANPDGSLEGSWLFIHGPFLYLEENVLTREVCNLQKKSGSSDVYQADCEVLKQFGDLTYMPGTASLSNDGIGHWPLVIHTEDEPGQFPYEGKLDNVAVENRAKIDGQAQFRALGYTEYCPHEGVGVDEPCYLEDWQDKPFAMVRIGDVNQALGQLKLRDISAVEIDDNAAYTDTVPVTGFKETMSGYGASIKEKSFVKVIENNNVELIRYFRYELFSGTNKPESRVLITEGQNKWLIRGYTCDDNGSDNGCDNIVYPRTEEASKYLTVFERTMAMATDGSSVSDADLVAQPDAYFDTLQNNAQQLQLHFQYQNAPAEKDGLIELSY